MAKVTRQENRMEREIAGKNSRGIFVIISTLQMFLYGRKLLPTTSAIVEHINTFHLHAQWMEVKWSTDTQT